MSLVGQAVSYTKCSNGFLVTIGDSYYETRESDFKRITGVCGETVGRITLSISQIQRIKLAGDKRKSGIQWLSA